LRRKFGPGMECQARVGKVRSAMEKDNIDALLVYSDAWDRASTYYLSGYNVVGPHALMILPKKGEASLLISTQWDLDRAREQTSFSNIKASDNFPRECRQILASLGLQASNIGIIGLRRMNALLYEAFKKELSKATFKDVAGILNDFMMVKSDEEIALMKKASEIGDAAVEAAVDIVKVGMKEYELLAEIEYVVRSKGAEDDFSLLGTAPNGVGEIANEHPPTRREIKKGDFIALEVSPFYKGYLIQKVRNIVIGPITKDIEASYDLYFKAYEKGIETAKEGVPCSEVARAMDEVIISAGYADYCRPPYFRVRGHGVGLGLLGVPPGSLIKGNETKLRSGATLAIHPSQFLPTKEGVMMYRTIGDTFVIRMEKAEPLTKLEPRIYSA